MIKKICLYTSITGVIIFFTWSFLRVNLLVTDVFSNMESERYSVDYDDIKETIGIDLKSFTKDNSIIKSYSTKKGMILVVGNYTINLNDNPITKLLVDGFYSLNNILDNLR